eukprot:357615-Chlamydomonas_euryale.AAC.1
MVWEFRGVLGKPPPSHSYEDNTAVIAERLEAAAWKVHCTLCCHLLTERPPPPTSPSRYMGSVIIGATTMEQLKENIDACEVELDEETCKAVDAIHLEIRNPNSTD